MTTIPVHCACGWTGFRIPAKIKARPCPACDGEVRRWRKLEKATAKVDVVAALALTPLEEEIDRKERAWREPLPRLPNPYVLYAMTGERQVFRIPQERRPGRRRRRA